MSHLLTSELGSLVGESLESGFLPSKLQRWHADIKNLTASAMQTAQSFVKVRFVHLGLSALPLQSNMFTHAFVWFVVGDNEHIEYCDHAASLVDCYWDFDF